MIDSFEVRIWNPDRDAKKRYQNKLRLIRFKDRNPDYEKRRWARDKDKRKAQKAARFKANPELRERENKRSRDYYYSKHEYHKAKRREYYAENAAEINAERKEYFAQYREENREACRERCRPHYRKNKAKRRAAQLERTPEWADKEAIKFFYECCPAGCHVDHIIPLRGNIVSGLHIETNLQWLPEMENLKKGNSFEVVV